MLSSRILSPTNVTATIVFCPRGFVIPDDIGRSTNIFINETISPCALSCMHPPTFTDLQQSIVEAVNVTGIVLTSVFAVLVVYIWWCDPMKRKQTFIMANGLVMGIGFFIMIFLTIPGPARLCQDNTTSVMGGPISVCVVEGALFAYIFIFTALCYGCQSFEVFRRVVLGYKRAPNMRIYLIWLLVTPLLLVIIALATGSFGRLPNYPMCGLVNKSGVIYFLMMTPIVAGTLFGFIFTFAVIIKLLWLTRQPEGISVSSGAYLTGSTAMYVVFSTGYFWSLLVISRLSIGYLRNRSDRVIEWGSCALENYDGSTSSSYTSVCGVQPQLPLPFATLCFWFLWSRVGFGLFYFLLNIEGFYRTVRKILDATKVLPLHYEYEEHKADSSSSVDTMTVPSSPKSNSRLITVSLFGSFRLYPPATLTPPRSASISAPNFAHDDS